MAAYKKSPGLIEQLVDGETVVLDQESGLLHQFNPTASEIWQCLDGESTIDSITQHISAKYDAAVEQVQADVESTLQEMENNKLIQAIQ